MKIEIWSDFACPYCYIGDTRLKKAIKELGLEKEVEITYKTFQLDPSAVKKEPQDYAKLLANKYNKSYSEAKEQVKGMIDSGKEIGLNFNFDILIRNNTTLAHKTAKYSKILGKEKEVVDCIFKAYFEEGADLGDLNTLSNLLKRVGVEKKNLIEELSKGDYTLEIHRDYETASSMNVRGVPFVVIDNKYSISGAQSLEHFKEALKSMG